jgi:hypothetical protein
MVPSELGPGFPFLGFCFLHVDRKKAFIDRKTGEFRFRKMSS